MHISQQDLQGLLVGSKLVSEEVFTTTIEEARRTQRDPIDVFVGNGVVSEAFLVDRLAEYFGVQKTDLRKEPIPPEVLNLVPESYAKSHNVVSFNIGRDGEGNEYAEVAMLDPGDLETISYLEAKLNRPIRTYITQTDSMREAFRQYRFGISSEFSSEIEEKLRELQARGKEEDLAELAMAVPVVSIIDRIVDHAISLDSSDIHFEPFEEIFLIRYRIDGILREVLALPVSVAPIFVARMKVLTNLKVDEHMGPQDGRFTFDAERERIDVRVSIVPVFWGEKVVMRLLRSASRPTSLASLGLNEKGMKMLEEESKRSHGMLLVTGPTGSGKSTTLYSVLQILNRPQVNISTIEDPVEYTITRVNQTQVNVQAGMTFASGLRAFLRQDPNILMVGEIRDAETADLSIHASLTGHLVLSTLHTNDAPTAIPRFLDLGAAPFLLASTLNVVIAQRLVRKLCDRCVSSRTPTDAEKRAFVLQAELLNVKNRIAMPKFFYHGAGCASCGGSGYRGRIGIFEVFRITEKVRELILQNAPTNKFRELAFAEGMTTMFEDGVEKVERGITTMEEILRVVRE